MYLSLFGVDHEYGCQYKVEARIRNHTSLDKLEVIQEVAKCVPETYVVDLDNAEVFFLVEIFKVGTVLIIESRT